MKIVFSKSRKERRGYEYVFMLWFTTEIVFRTKYGDLIQSIFPSIERNITYIVLVLLLVQIIFFQKYLKEELYTIIPISILIIISTITSGINYLLSAWLFLVGSKNTNISLLIERAYKILMILIPIIILGSVFGFIPDIIKYRGNIVRHSLGFSHPNSLGLTLFQFMLCYCYVKWENFRWYNLLIILIGILFNELIADSQTATYGMSLLLILIIIFKAIDYFKQNISVVFCRILQSISLILGIGNILLAKINIRNYQLLRELDIFLSQRFSMAHIVYKIFGESWFGNKLYISENERELVGIHTSLYLDSAYCNLWLRFGGLVLLLFIVSYFLLYNRVKSYPVLVIILFVYSVYGVMEAGLIQMRNNVFLLLFSYLIYSKKGKNIYLEERYKCE